MSIPIDLLLLTATVSPRQDQPNLAVVSAVERLDEYRKALAHYTQLLDNGVIRGIIFAENSGYDLAELAAVYPSPGIEWLSIDPAPHAAEFHRGYAEFKLIDSALARSAFWQRTNSNIRIWKVSGRYIVRNLGSVIRWAPQRFDLYASIGREWFEMSIVAWNLHAHQQLMQGVWQHFATAEAPERVLCRLLEDPGAQSLRVVRSFTWPPIIQGRRGTDGSPFQGRRTRYRFMLMAVGKLVCLPWRRIIGA